MNINALPYYVKSTVILAGITLFVAMLYILQDLLIPLTYAVFLAIILFPLDRFLEEHHIHRIIAISIALLVAILAVALIALAVESQLSGFVERAPEFMNKIKQTWSEIQLAVQRKFGFSAFEQKQFVQKMASEGVGSGSGVVGTTFQVIGNLILIPIYAYLFLYYRELFEEFLIRLFVKEGSVEEVRAILRKNTVVLFDYLVGKWYETLIVAALSTLGLYLVGVDYAILFGILAGLFNLIPFIGAQLAAIPPIIISMITKDSIWYPVGIAAMFTLIQFIDNHLVIPLVVGPKININAFMVVLALIGGDMLWGVSGMILSLPLTAMLKVIFDNVPQLQPWGLVLGSKLPPKSKQLREKAVHRKEELRKE